MNGGCKDCVNANYLNTMFPPSLTGTWYQNFTQFAGASIAALGLITGSGR